jgi:hypothetical protein
MKERQLKNLKFHLNNEYRDKIGDVITNSNINTMDIYFPKRIHYSISEYIDFPYGDIYIPKNYILNIDDGEYEIVTDYIMDESEIDTERFNEVMRCFKDYGFELKYIETISDSFNIDCLVYEINFGVTTIKNGVLDLKQFDSLFRNWKEIDNHIYIEKMSKVEDENKIVLGLGS